MRTYLAALPCIACALALGPSLSAQILDDYEPQASAVLSTDFQQVRSKKGRLVTIVNGIYVFRNVRIPRGVTIRGTGAHPMIWVVTGDFRVDGRLSVDGRDGAHVNTLNAANFPTPGGAAGPAGGDGGRGSPSSTRRSFAGEAGNGPYQFPRIGGVGAPALLGIGLSLQAPGGGGGSFALVGDPHYRRPGQVVTGRGGSGRNRSGLVAGGRPGTALFASSFQAHTFFGIGYDYNLKRPILGSVPFLMGGEGSGGGDRYPRLIVKFINDKRGGGGGGGGGALMIYAFGTISVTPSGTITANGGAGGGGEVAGSCREGGGGGGGSGGMLILAAQNKVSLAVKGDTYAATGDASFVLSADGGIGRNTSFGNGAPRLHKYPEGPGAPNAGGFGGLGIVQIITRTGKNADGTNTVLDDHIELLQNGRPLKGAAKQRFLAWRGLPNAQGKLVDDSGKPANTGAGGDIRPSPILLPLF